MNYAVAVIIHTISCSLSREAFLQVSRPFVSRFLLPAASSLQTKNVHSIKFTLLTQELTTNLVQEEPKENTSSHLQSKSLFNYSVPRSSNQQSMK